MEMNAETYKREVAKRMRRKDDADPEALGSTGISRAKDKKNTNFSSLPFSGFALFSFRHYQRGRPTPSSPKLSS